MSFVKTSQRQLAAIANYSKSQMILGTVPVIIVKPISDESREQLRKEWEDLHKGPPREPINIIGD